jgi:hypothetical protein
MHLAFPRTGEVIAVALLECFEPDERPKWLANCGYGLPEKSSSYCYVRVDDASIGVSLSRALHL